MEGRTLPGRVSTSWLWKLLTRISLAKAMLPQDSVCELLSV